MVSLSEGMPASDDRDAGETSRSSEGGPAGQAPGSRVALEEHQGDQDSGGASQDDVSRHSDRRQSGDQQGPSFSAEPERYTSHEGVPLWTNERGYEEGEMVWYEGTYWRCEADHPRDQSYGPPNEALHLWTPTHSTSPYNPAEGVPTDTAFSSCSNLPLAMPQPTKRLSKTRAMLEKNASPPESGYTSGSGSGPGQDESHEKDDSPDSAITVTPQNSRPSSTVPRDSGSSSGNTAAEQHPQQQQRHAGPQQQGTTAYLSAKADEGIRYLASRHEKHKAGISDELRAELRGQRIFRMGGLGMWAYSEDRNQERVKEDLWTTAGQEFGREGWLESARRRTHYYKTSIALKPLIQWHLHTPTSGPLPRNALPIGYEGGDGAPLFAARAWHEGGLHIGKAGNHLYHGASISYGGAEITLDTFEVLCGPLPEEGGGSGLLKWMMFRHGEMCGVEGWQPVEGGREKSGEVLLIAKGEWERGQHPGKVRIGDDHAHVPWGGGEVWVRPFQVLAYAHSVRR